MKISIKPSQIIEGISTAFILLFTYTAFSKLREHAAFRETLSKSPLLKEMADFVSYALPILELMVAGLLFFPVSRKWGFKISLFLTTGFTGYLIYMIYFTSELPCSCGGIITSLTWKQHLLFNIALTMLSALGLHLLSRHKLFIAINRGSRKPV